MSDKVGFQLYSENCVKCGHLDPSKTKRWSTCHYEKGKKGKGNEYCPAKTVQIVVVGRAIRWAGLVRDARRRRDIAVESKILAQVAKEQPAFIERFYKFLEEGFTNETN